MLSTDCCDDGDLRERQSKVGVEKEKGRGTQMHDQFCTDTTRVFFQCVT